MPKIQPTVFTLTVREVLKLPSLASSTVIAGADGLGRTVTTAMVLEGPDIEHWGRSGLLLITSLYALDPLTPEGRLAFIEKAAKIGISGIIFKPDRVASAMPSEIVSSCDELGIPIAKISSQTKYESILRDVMGSMLDGNVVLLKRFFEMHRSTTKLALEQPSIYAILTEVRTVLGVDVTFYNHSSKVGVSTNPAYSHIGDLSLTELERGTLQTFHYYRATIGRDRGGSPCLAVLVPNSKRIALYLIIHASPESVSAMDLMAAESYVGLLQMEFLKQGAVEAALYRRNNVIVHDLLLDRCSTRESVDRALKELSLDTLPLYQAMLVRFHVQDQSQRPRLHDLLERFIGLLKCSYSHFAVYSNDNRIVLLRNLSNETQEFNPKTITKALKTLHKDHDAPTFTHLVALSEHQGRYAIGQLNRQVLGIFRLFDANKAEDRLVHYRDLGIYKLFLGVGDLSDISEYIDSKVKRLVDESPSLFETIATLCEKDVCYSDTASALFVHPKTVHYRIKRIKELYDIDVHRTEDLSRVLLASKVLTLLGRRWRGRGGTDG